MLFQAYEKASGNGVGLCGDLGIVAITGTVCRGSSCDLERLVGHTNVLQIKCKTIKKIVTIHSKPPFQLSEFKTLHTT